MFNLTNNPAAQTPVYPQRSMQHNVPYQDQQHGVLYPKVNLFGLETAVPAQQQCLQYPKVDLSGLGNVTPAQQPRVGYPIHGHQQGMMQPTPLHYVSIGVYTSIAIRTIIGNDNPYYPTVLSVVRSGLLPYIPLTGTKLDELLTTYPDFDEKLVRTISPALNDEHLTMVRDSWMSAMNVRGVTTEEFTTARDMIMHEGGLDKLTDTITEYNYNASQLVQAIANPFIAVSSLTELNMLVSKVNELVNSTPFVKVRRNQFGYCDPRTPFASEDVSADNNTQSSGE